MNAVKATIPTLAGVEWHLLYGRRWTAFLDGVARGDCYEAGAGIYRVRLWPPGRLQGGTETLVLGSERAREVLLDLLERARREEATE